MHSTIIEEEAFYRLRNYPDQILNNMHHAIVTLPRQIAFLLQQKPSYISPAVEAFYLRDPVALRPLQTKESQNLIFNAEDLVNVSVKMPRVAYAQLKTQDFQPPPIWKSLLARNGEPERATRIETGMKISCSFEMLVSDSQNKDKTAVREIKMLLEDLEVGDERLPTDEEIDQWAKPEDDEKWLEISLEDLEGELAGKAGTSSKRSAGFGDQKAQENLQRIVAQFESLMNEDEADPDAKTLFEDDSEELDVESSSEGPSEGEDVDASFDEERFGQMMREMMGMPPDADVDNVTVRNMVPGLVQELDSDGEEENADDVQTLMSRMEAELNDLGALGPDSLSSKTDHTEEQTSQKGKDHARQQGNSQSDAVEDDDIDTDFARNILQSFRSQARPASSARK